MRRHPHTIATGANRTAKTALGRPDSNQPEGSSSAQLSATTPAAIRKPPVSLLPSGLPSSQALSLSPSRVTAICGRRPAHKPGRRHIRS